MGFNRFGLLLSIRLLVLLVTIGTGGLLMSSGRYPSASLLVLIVAVLMLLELVRYVTRTNQELARFLDAARYADYGQRFEFSGIGAGFNELGDTFTHILGRFRDDRREQEGELRHLKAILEHVPVPIISVYGDETVTLWNNAARRLFGPNQIARLEDLKPFGAALAGEIRRIQPGQKVLVNMDVDSLSQSVTLSASEIVTSSRTERLISVHNIQTELDGMQLQAWQDLVRVLTHEIMNSVTPVSSLAKTASDLIEDVSVKVATQAELVEELRDVKNAVDTVARRSDSLMSFVDSYRRLLRLPEPDRTVFNVRDLFDDVARIAAVGWPTAGITLEKRVEPEGLTVHADRQMLEQVLINLLQNAEHALAGYSNGSVRLAAKLNPRGQAIIEISDNGSGITDDVAKRMFVPFYTTRKEGSGVGLALSRQIMNAHGGTISFGNRPDSVRTSESTTAADARRGATFTLAF